MFSLLAAMVIAQTATIAPVDGTRLAPTRQCFAILRGGEEVGATLQTIAATEIDGMPAWDIVVHQRLAGFGFDMRDHFVLQRSDLRPIRFDSHAMRGDARHEIELVYAADRVHGTRISADGEEAIDVALAGPVWEGNLWGVTFGALPLAEGGHYELPYYQYDKGIGRFALDVTGSERVDTPEGPVEAWTVAVESAPGRKTTYLIAKADGAELGTRSEGFSTRLGGDCSEFD